ncbi:MAG: DUF192 domain-containing protein [Candidatus Pacebacteria bacterium]|nr:DUF192 domain-containing protein [Candidatus Paceibacterota bacterium]
MNRLILLALSLPTAIIFGVPAILVSIPHKENTILQTPQLRLSLESADVSIFIADTAHLRQQGLSGVPKLPDGHGLFFAFSKSDEYGVWMRSMLFPIDIIWFDDRFRVIAFEENVTPESYPQVYRPKTPARYILEVNAGVVEEAGIEIGSVAHIDYRIQPRDGSAGQ